MKQLLSLSALFSVLIGTALYCPAQEVKPNRHAFLEEVLNAQPTAITPQFDSYHKGNYRVVKHDVVNGLIEEAKKQQLPLENVLIVGPVGVLWSYYVLIFLNDKNENLRVNLVVTAHARIVDKSTALITRKRYEDLKAKLFQTGILQTDLPTVAKAFKGKREEEFDFRYEVIFYQHQAELNHSQIYYGTLERLKPDKKTEAFLTPVNNLVKSLKTTYPMEKKTPQK